MSVQGQRRIPECAWPEGFVPFHRASLERSIPALFEERAAARPGDLAVKIGGDAISYGQLNAAANRLAQALLARLGEGEEGVALFTGKSGLLAESVLGTLKAGKFYLPLDPGHPKERLAAMLRHAGGRLAVTDRHHLERVAGLTGPEVHLLCLDEPWSGEPAGNPGRPIPPDRTASLHYTSGSTGGPKGVFHSHRAVLHSVMVRINHYGLSRTDQVSLLTQPGFAASQGVLLATLIAGGTLHLFDPREEGLSRLAGHLRDEAITFTVMPPSLLREFFGTLAPGETFPALRLLVATGEPLLREDVARFWTHAGPRSVLVQQYASTENFIMAFQYLNRDRVLAEGPVPAGFPVEDKELLLMDATGHSVPSGEVGEIAVRSRYLAGGYWRDGSATEAVFRREGDGRTVCRTGDQGRFLPDGSLAVLGRTDSMVKIRGYRVELAEIDAILMSVPGVREACTVAGARPDGQVELTAFYSLHPVTAAASRRDLRALLAARLPDYQRPHRLVELPELPRLAQGKIDRTELARRQAKPPRMPEGNSPPASDLLELQLRSLWEKALRRKNIQRGDDFFQLGGDSLSAAKLFHLIERHLGVNPPLSALAAHPTVARLAGCIRGLGWQPLQSPLVLLQPQGEAKPLFVLPGAGSDVFALIPLARHLAPDIPVYGCQHRGLAGDRRYHQSVAEMAASVLDQVLKVQPAGPYRLCGTSFGGLVAFEMAQRLRQRGEEVEFLILLDTHGPGYPRRRRWLSPRGWAIYLLRQLLPIGRKDQLTLPNLHRGVRVHLQRLLARLDMFLRWRKVPPLQARFLYLQEVCFRAAKEYRIEKYPGRLHLFVAEQQPRADLFEQDPWIGWQGLASGGIERISIQGRHGEHIREPQVRDLALKLRQLLLQSPAAPRAACPGEDPAGAGS